MAKFNDKNDETKAEPYCLTAVTHMEEWKQAKDCEAMLKAYEIPAYLVVHESPKERTKKVAVLVPKDFEEEACAIIESKNAEDEFSSLMYDDDDIYESDLFDKDTQY